MQQEYEKWKAEPSKANLSSLLTKTRPQIDKAMKMYVGNDDKVARSHAKVLAVRAFRGYDPTKGTQLQTHFLTQLQPLRRFAAKRRMVFNVPEGVQQDKAALLSSKQELEDRLDRMPSDIELADHTGLSVKRIHSLRARKTDQAEGARVNENGEMFQDVTQKPSKMNAWSDYVYHDLNPMDKKIYEWRTGFGGRKVLTNGEIAKRLRLTGGAVSQRADKILRRLEEGLQYVD